MILRPGGAISFSLGLIALSFAAVLPAQNLAPNHDFEEVDQTAGWSLLAGQAVQWIASDRDSCPDSGSLQVFVSPVFGDRAAQGSFSAFAWTDCIAIPSPLSTLHVRFAWTDNSSATATVVTYPDGGCADLPSPDSVTLSGDDGAWNTFDASFAVSGAAAVRLEIGFSSSPFFDLIADRVYLGAVPPLFLDDFEGGGAICRWSPLP